MKLSAPDDFDVETEESDESGAREPVTVETEMWGEQSVDEFAETVTEMVAQSFGAADRERVEEIERAVAELQAGFESLAEGSGRDVEFQHDLREDE